MSDEGLEYADVLKEAQRLGYAEANPSADVDGFDSMYKLSILSSLAFHTKVPISQIYREGISSINKTDIEFGKKFGYTLKLLAIAKTVGDKIEARVHPAFIPSDHPLASVKGSFNAVFIQGNNVGDIMLYGRGAGDLPTGSAIVSDIVFAAKQNAPEYTSFENVNEVDESKFSKDFRCKYFIRMAVKDEAGVLAKIAACFAKFDVSIETMQQVNGSGATIIFLTHKTTENDIKGAVQEIEHLKCGASVDALIRVEE